ncbi:unnamed protein product [Zymoseptoria tritici ST99CH_1A5]|uniref:F-box domain-containing protein n=1 Tax=Zymoseptoria tritici ST99CH_1A5 TaxID=1276529 RepID=A0A1Y6LHX7_ZYMTR|nr:unnamed protein product [Zymoseptoria tritici ST99CH_1A5]
MTSNKPASFKINASAMSPVSAPAASEAQPFRLLDLPDELWARIGKTVIEASAPIHVTRANPEGLKTALPSILHTCSALRNELLLSYYSTKFGIDLTTHYLWGTDWLRGNLGRYLRLIGSDAASALPASYDSYWYWSGWREEDVDGSMAELQTDLQNVEDWIGCHVRVLSKRIERRDHPRRDQRMHWEVCFVETLPLGERRMLRD